METRCLCSCTFASPWKVIFRKQAWDHPHRRHRHIQAPLDSPIRFATPNTLPLLNVLKSLHLRRVDVKSILMFTRNVRKRREKLGWNAIGADPYSLRA